MSVAARCVLGRQRFRFMCFSLCPQCNASAHQAASSSACRSRSNCDTCQPTLFVINNHLPPRPKCLPLTSARTAAHIHHRTGFTSLSITPESSACITCELAACIMLLSRANHPPAAALGNSHAYSIHEGSCQQLRRRLHCVSVNHSAPERRAVFPNCNWVLHRVNLQMMGVRICIPYPSVNP